MSYKPSTSIKKRKPPPIGGTSGDAGGGERFSGESSGDNEHDSCGGIERIFKRRNKSAE